MPSINSQTTQTKSNLTSHLEIGVVELFVHDLEKQRPFYESLVGLPALSESKDSVTLGFENNPIITLIADQNLTAAPAGSAGLYHTAIVFSSREALAQSLLRILSQSPDLYAGSADHLVSEAFYFSDPEGNGVELYFDKNPQTWIWQNGHVRMDSIYIDIKKYISEHSQEPSNRERKVGHVHLKVGSITEAKLFYPEILGFRITAEMPTALFISDGQYHHHLGMNIWESNGAGSRVPSTGLKSVLLYLEDKSDLEKLIARLTKSKIQFEKDEEILRVSDPWLNQLFFSVKITGDK